MYANDLKNLNFNLHLLANKEIKQRQTASQERTYYFNRFQYNSDPEKYNQELEYDESKGVWFVRNKWSSYRQSPDLLSWE